MNDHNREALIEKAAKAMLDDSHGEGTWEVRTPMEEELYLRRSRAALAVFEQAHTPTSGERLGVCEWCGKAASGYAAWQGDLTGADHLSCGRDGHGFDFRRPEVPEPQAEPTAAEGTGQPTNHEIRRRD